MHIILLHEVNVVKTSHSGYHMLEEEETTPFVVRIRGRESQIGKNEESSGLE